MRRGLTAGGLFWLLLMAPPALAADQSVTISGYAFGPATVHVDPGDKVTWTWAGPDTNHSVTAADWDSDPGNPYPSHPVGDRFSHTFTTAGTYMYVCKVHSYMHGTVVVDGSSSPPPPPPPPPSPPPPSDPPPDTTAPLISGAKLKKTTLTYSLDEPGSVAITLKLSKSARGARGGNKSRAFKQAGKPGTNKLKLATKGLRRGRYKLTLSVTDAAGNKSNAPTLKLTIR